jgi:hypothetical protein
MQFQRFLPKMPLRWLLLVLLFAEATLSAPARPTKEACASILLKADKCYQSILVVGDPSASNPDAPGAMDRFCKKWREEDLKCVRSYAKCLRAFPRQVFSIVFNSVKNEVANRCTNVNSRKEFSDTFSILWPSRSSVDGIINKITNFNMAVAANVSETNQNDMIPSICCGHHYLEIDLFATAQRLHGDQPALYLRKALDNLFSDVMDFTCSKFKNPGVCDKEMPYVKGLYNKDISYPGHGTLVPLIKFANNLA